MVTTSSLGHARECSRQVRCSRRDGEARDQVIGPGPWRPEGTSHSQPNASLVQTGGLVFAADVRHAKEVDRRV